MKDIKGYSIVEELDHEDKLLCELVSEIEENSPLPPVWGAFLTVAVFGFVAWLFWAVLLGMSGA